MNSWLIAGIILAIGFFICLFLILRSKWKQNNQHVADYEVRRDKLTFRKKKEVVEEDDGNWFDGGFNPGSIIMGIMTLAIVLAVGTTILSEFSSVLNETTSTNPAMNVTNAMTQQLSGVVSFFPLIFAIAIVGVVISVIARSFGSSGLM